MLLPKVVEAAGKSYSINRWQPYFDKDVIITLCELTDVVYGREWAVLGDNVRDEYTVVITKGKDFKRINARFELLKTFSAGTLISVMEDCVKREQDFHEHRIVW